MSANGSSVHLTDGRKLSYLLSGPSSKPIVLLSNPLCAPYHTWDQYVTYLHSHNFRTLQYDQIGHGDSSPPSVAESITFDTLSSDIRFLLDALDIQNLHAFIGISMGAATGIYFATQNPGRVERLVICDTISHSPNAVGVEAEDAFDARVAAARKDGSVDNTAEQTLTRWFSEEWRESHKEELERMRRIMRTTKVEGFAACCRALQDKNFDLRPLVGKLGGAVEKVLVVVGELDANLPDTMAAMRKEIQAGFEKEGKNVEVEWALIKNAGHVGVVDGFDEYSKVVTKFLES